MEEKLIRKSKWFWAWEDEKEEAWLRQMTREGWHLVNPGILGQYTFAPGEAQDMVYRLDFISLKMKTAEYYQLFQDAGWEHVGELSGWQYWRKPHQEDEDVPEIFTDNESKAEKYRRVLLFAVIFIPILIINITNLTNATFNPLYRVASYLSIALLVIYVYILLRVMLRIRELRQM